MKTPHYKIRPATTQDIPELTNLIQSTFATAFGNSMSPQDLKVHLSQNLSTKEISQFLRQDTILVAQHPTDQKLIAYIQFGPKMTDSTSKWINRVYVLHEYQNQGIGSQLIKSALQHPILKNAPQIQLEVWIKNARAIKLYQSFGFTKTGERYLEFASGPSPDPDIIMTKYQI